MRFQFFLIISLLVLGACKENKSNVKASHVCDESQGSHHHQSCMPEAVVKSDESPMESLSEKLSCRFETSLTGSGLLTCWQDSAIYELYLNDNSIATERSWFKLNNGEKKVLVSGEKYKVETVLFPTKMVIPDD